MKVTMMNKKVFISTPISGFKDVISYGKFRSFILHIIESLRGAGFEVCSEIESISTAADYISPTKSIEEDFYNIKSADIFLFIHPMIMQTSSFIELGFACANNKRILIVGNKSDLPYLAKGLEASYVQAILLNTLQLDETIIPRIIENMEAIN